MYTNAKMRGLEHVLAMPLWYNSTIMDGKIQSWENAGISTVGDMIDTEGHILPLEYIRNTLQLKCDFLLHYRLKIE